NTETTELTEIKNEKFSVVSVVSVLYVSCRALPDRTADEERSEPLEVQRGLLRLAHRLHDRREWIQLLPDQSDDEVVVLFVEAVARQADVVRVVAGPERHADGAVLGENHPLLFRRELREPAAPPQRIPERPPPVAIQHCTARPMDENVGEVRLVT